jgi:hypothetical protein
MIYCSGFAFASWRVGTLAIDLTNKEIPPIFTKVSNNVNNIAMTIADHIREETTFNVIRNLLQKGYDASFIAEITEISVKKVQGIIQKIKESN